MNKFCVLLTRTSLILLSWFMLSPLNQNADARSNTEMMNFGIENEVTRKSIDRINLLNNLYNQKNYFAIEEQLKNDLVSYSKNEYAKQRVLNELAHLYSFYLMDIESAIRIDEKLLQMDIIEADNLGDFYPRTRVSLNTVLGNVEYASSFPGKSKIELEKNLLSRYKMNNSLLGGIRLVARPKYTLEFLENHLVNVNTDLKNLGKQSKNYEKYFSRKVRTEYELSRISDYKITTLDNFRNKSILLNDIEYDEINFLQLSLYFITCYEQTDDVYFLELALKTIYKPYINLRNPEYRLNYNNLINQYIGLLINANFKESKYQDMLYYISLNKSRMILEERLAYTSGSNLHTKISDLTANDGVQRDEHGLPTKQWFLSKIAKTNNYFDMYVDNSDTSLSSATSVSKLANQNSPTRGLIRESFANLQQSKNDDEKIYLTYIKNGKILSVKKLKNDDTVALKDSLDKSYYKVLNHKEIDVSKFPHSLGFNANSNQSSLVISPDKWLSKYPYDFFFKGNTVRSVNLFTHNPQSTKLSNISIAGFFNPTLDLAGTEYEAKIMKQQFPNANINIGNQAKLKTLSNTSNNNVVHLSMHGVFNEQNPVYSKLLFNGANKAIDTNDSNSLYAKNIYQYQALKNQDLIFTAACQTGLTANARKNQNEMVGILRPLIANGNKNVILSLWDVDDMATSLFVESFYTHLAKTKDIQKSFSHAQNMVKQKYNDAYYWSAFYLLKVS